MIHKGAAFAHGAPPAKFVHFCVQGRPARQAERRFREAGAKSLLSFPVFLSPRLCASAVKSELRYRHKPATTRHKSLACIDLVG